MEPLTADDQAAIGGYRLLGRIGAGGMGRVYLAQSASGRLVAVKVVYGELARQPEFRMRFAREVEAARKVGGFWTAAVVDADPLAEAPWLATEYVPGPALNQAVSAAGPLPVDSLRVLAAGLCEALAAIHRAGLVHRDLKPGNVLLAADGPRVIDFGIARALDSTAITAGHYVVGTPGFMAPEQVADGEVSAASDVFCLGLTLAYAATARAPFGAGSMLELSYRLVNREADLDGVPDGFREVIELCLRKDPAARPTAVELLGRLSASPATRMIGGPGGAALGSVPPALAASVSAPATWLTPGLGQLVAGYSAQVAPMAPTDQPQEAAMLAGPTNPPGAGAADRTTVAPKRQRWMVGLAAAAVIAIGVGVYAVLPDGGHQGGTSSALGGTTPAASSSSMSAMTSTSSHTTSPTGTSGAPDTSRPASPVGPAQAITCGTGKLTINGSTVQLSAMTQWIKAYQAACPAATVAYEGNGTGAGLAAANVDATGVDYPLNAAQKNTADARCSDGGHAVAVPAVTAAVVLVYNVPGVSQLNLSPATLARIFAGTATTWDDQSIAADNPGVTLPTTPIAAFHHSAVSASTLAFQTYLATAAPSSFPSPSQQWTAPGGQGAGSSQALITAVRSTQGAIGYVDLPYAAASGLSKAKVGSPGHYTDVTTAPADYPIVHVTSEIVCGTGNHTQNLPLLKDFLAYTLSDAGQAALSELGYIPLSDADKRDALSTVAGLR